MDGNQPIEEGSGPKWQPIEALERRVLGVLIEKAKTTPDNYPLSLNALKNGCNQKSNRFPQMEKEEDEIETTCETLRKLGAISQIQGGHRIDKYRHLAYDWLGVDKFEIAVMAELLLRGAQTIGELRARAARMEPIASQSELMPILNQLHQKKLILYLTPPGRGAIVTHNLYQPRELEKVQRDHGGAIHQPSASSYQDSYEEDDSEPQSSVELEYHETKETMPVPSASQTASSAMLHAMHEEIVALQEKWCSMQEEIMQLKANVAELRSVIED